MISLVGSLVKLRALEPEDLDFLYRLENDTEIWEISGTLTPYSRNVLQSYLDSAHRDIYEVKQLRLAICTDAGMLIGMIDLFDFDPRHLRAGIGVVIADPEARNQGYGAEAIRLVCEYGFEVLGLHQLYASVGEGNQASLHLFRKLGFIETGRKRDWLRTADGFKDELILQKISADEA